MKLCIYGFRAFDEPPFFEALQKQYGFTYKTCSEHPSLDNVYLASGCDGVITTVVKIDAPLLDAFKAQGIRFVVTRTIGYDHIDLDYAKQIGLRVGHAPYGPESVADYTVMLMMMSLRKMQPILKRAEVQDYSLKGKLGKDLRDCTIGIIGTGQIGACVIRRLAGFDASILAYDPYEKEEVKKYATYVSLDALYEACDLISLHTPGGEGTYHLIDKDALCKMQEGVTLINTARGTLIDTQALIEALEDGKVEAAALDVIEDETGLCYINRMGECIPNRQMAILRSFPNVLLTTHTAFYTRNDVASMAAHAIQCIYDMAEGKENPFILI